MQISEPENPADNDALYKARNLAESLVVQEQCVHASGFAAHPRFSSPTWTRVSILGLIKRRQRISYLVVLLLSAPKLKKGSDPRRGWPGGLNNVPELHAALIFPPFLINASRWPIVEGRSTATETYRV